MLRRLASVGTSLFCCVSALLGQEPPAAPETIPDPPTESPAVPEVKTIRDAEDLFFRGAPDEALKAFERLSADPKPEPAARLGIARCLIRLGKYDEAIDALLAHPAEATAKWHFILAQAYNLVGRYNDVIQRARAAMERDPNGAGPRLLLAQTLEMLGRRDEAIETYRWFDRQLVEREDLPRDAEWITSAAIGLVRYSVLTRTNVVDRTKHALQEMLQVAYERVDRHYWPARVAAGDLLRERYNNDEADGSVSDYLAALRINEHLPEAHVGLGAVALEGWAFEKVEAAAQTALETNPNYVPAINLLAVKFSLERRYDEAMEACDRALAINSDDLTTLSLCAATCACRYDTKRQAEFERRITAINPNCASYYHAIGSALSGIRQFEPSERALLKAIELEPTNANARTELGMMYMQWGPEDKAREALEAAWALDSFNERTNHTLDLLQMLDRFARYETDHFIVKYDQQRDPGLGEYVAPYLEELYAEVTADYDMPLEHKTVIEMFPTQRQFGVRITGKPWIHTVGACTGRVIALATPRESVELMGTYNLANVLRHEFTHTVTLAATENRIPHWFTEGLAVYQEDTPRSFAWSELLADAIRHDRLFTLESIDWGFIRPRRPQDRQMAYAQSEWMCEFIVERWGYDTIQKLVASYRRGQTQPQALQEQLGISPESFDEQFRVWARSQAARWGFDLTPPEELDEMRSLAEKEPESAAVHGRLARAAMDASEFEAAVKAAERAIELDEKEINGLTVLGTALAEHARQESHKDVRRTFEDRAIDVLIRLAEVDPRGGVAPKYLSEIYLRRKEWDRALEPLQTLQRLRPMDPASWSGLAGIYLERGDEDAALPQLLELARIEDGDAEVRAKIASIYRKRGALQDARFWLGRAVFIDPFSAKLHLSLAETFTQMNDHEPALREYTMLTKLEPGNAAHWEQAAVTAKRLNRNDEARRFAQKAVELKPDSIARNLLRDQPAGER